MLAVTFSPPLTKVGGADGSGCDAEGAGGCAGAFLRLLDGPVLWSNRAFDALPVPSAAEAGATPGTGWSCTATAAGAAAVGGGPRPLGSGTVL